MLQQHTKLYTRKDSSLNSLFEPPLSSEKVAEFLVFSQETKSPAPSSQTLLITLLINTYLLLVESSTNATTKKKKKAKHPINIR